jgi:hypothetical protein
MVHPAEEPEPGQRTEAGGLLPAPEPSRAPAPEPSRAPAPSVRVGDAEREAVVARLQAALNEGRLDLSEFEERSSVAYAARTEGELVPLIADLPANLGLNPKTPRDPNTAEVMAARKRRLLTGAESAWVRTAIILIVIWAISAVASSSLNYFWPIWPLGIWGAVLLARRFTGDHRD